MKLIPIRHEDHRRTLTEWISDIPMKRSKVIEVKEKSVLGNHYHHNSDSVFYILKGKGLCVLKDLEGVVLKREWMFENDCIFVPREVVHTFTLWPNTIMLESASEKYDSNDEIQYFE